MDIDRKIEAMRARLERSRPCRMTITLKSGEQIETDPIGAWAVCRDHMMQGDVINVTADRPEYAAAAGIMTVLCHPVPNRRLADYE